MANVSDIIWDLKRRRDLIDETIVAIEKLGDTGRGGATRSRRTSPVKGSRRLSAETRRKMAEACRIWWASRKAAA